MGKSNPDDPTGANSGTVARTSNSPFGHSQNVSSQDGLNIPTVRSKNVKKKRGKNFKKVNNHHAIDGEYDGDINNYYNKTTKRKVKHNNYGTNDSAREKKNATQADFHKHSYIIEGPREGAAAQSIRLNSLAAMEKNNTKMNLGRGQQAEKPKPSPQGKVS